ncbi:hypothetical protein C4577_06085 [Candidatus Parcubacteria bacterium]|nr:MAG: hypothetical protein C4577_06085 [Candidatus Parcubacteria bacterium]
MNRVLKILFFIIIAFNIFFASWYVLHNDIEFTSEVARDLFLLDEISKKKIVLIGPSSTTGLFHGPLWTYINYPAYAIGQGDPVVVGWGWISFIILFLISSYYIGKNLFDSRTGYLFTLMLSIYSVYIAKNLYNPHGAFFLVPAFFFFFIRYIETLKVKYLIIHVLLTGMIIQFQMAIGIPFLILSFLYIALLTIKSQKYLHLLSFSLILLTLSNFLIFNLRHESLLSQQVMKFITSGSSGYHHILQMLEQRFRFMVGGAEILRVDPGNINYILFLILIVFLVFQIVQNKNKKIYFSFLYFYFGYLIISNLNGGGLLYFYLFPLFPLVFLIFSSFSNSKYPKVFMGIFFVIFLLNTFNALDFDIKSSYHSMGKSEWSWMFYKKLALEVFTGKEEFGYFVYSPDVVGYRPKYALFYTEKLYPHKAIYFQKKPVTYLIIAPPPSNNPYMKDEWWRINLLHINKKPESVINFDNGYKIEKYFLSEKEILVPVEQGIDPGIHFR